MELHPIIERPIVISYLYPGLPSVLFHSGFPTRILYVFLFISLLTHACYMPHQSHPARVNDCNNTRSGIQIMKLSLHNFLQRHVTSSRMVKSTTKLWCCGLGSGSWLRIWSYKESFLLFKRKIVVLVLNWHGAECKQFTNVTMQCNLVIQKWSNLMGPDLIYLFFFCVKWPTEEFI